MTSFSPEMTYHKETIFAKFYSEILSLVLDLYTLKCKDYIEFKNKCACFYPISPFSILSEGMPKIFVLSKFGRFTFNGSRDINIKLNKRLTFSKLIKPQMPNEIHCTE